MMTTNPFADRIIALKLENNLSNVELQNLCGCKNQSISAWLTKDVYPKFESLMRLSRNFDCSIDYLLGLTDDKKTARRETFVPFAQRISELIENNKTTEYAVAKAANFDRSCFIHWRKRNLLPKTETAIKLAEFFNCSMEYLFGLSDIR